MMSLYVLVVLAAVIVFASMFFAYRAYDRYVERMDAQAAREHERRVAQDERDHQIIYRGYDDDPVYAPGDTDAIDRELGRPFDRDPEADEGDRSAGTERVGR